MAATATQLAFMVRILKGDTPVAFDYIPLNGEQKVQFGGSDGPNKIFIPGYDSTPFSLATYSEKERQIKLAGQSSQFCSHKKQDLKAKNPNQKWLKFNPLPGDYGSVQAKEYEVLWKVVEVVQPIQSLKSLILFRPAIVNALLLLTSLFLSAACIVFLIKIYF